MTAVAAPSGGPSQTRLRVEPTEAHYLRLLVTPLSADPQPIDCISFLLVASKIVSDWFGAVGPGPGGGEIEVIHAGEVDASGGRDVFVKVPRSTATSIITALPLSNPSISGQAYAIRLVNHADSLSKLAGPAGEGRAGWKAWTESLR